MDADEASSSNFERSRELGYFSGITILHRDGSSCRLRLETAPPMFHMN
jgi:hypothetical protein